MKIGIIKSKIKASEPVFDFVHILDKDKEYSSNEYAELIAKNYDINEPKIKKVYDELISNKDKIMVYKDGMWKIELNDEIPEDIDASKKDKKGLESGPDKTEQRLKNDNPKPKESNNDELLKEKLELFLSKISKDDFRRPKYELMLKEIKMHSKEKPLKDLNEEGRMNDIAQLNKEGLPENSKVKGNIDKKINKGDIVIFDFQDGDWDELESIAKSHDGQEATVTEIDVEDVEYNEDGTKKRDGPHYVTIEFGDGTIIPACDVYNLTEKVKGSYEDEENELKEEIIDEAKVIYKKNKNFKEMALSLLDIQRFKHYLESVIGNEFDIEQWIENELIDSETGELRASDEKLEHLKNKLEKAKLEKEKLEEQIKKYKEAQKNLESSGSDDLQSKASHVFGKNAKVVFDEEGKVKVYVNDEIKLEGTKESITTQLEDMIAEKDKLDAAKTQEEKLDEQQKAYDIIEKKIDFDMNILESELDSRDLIKLAKMIESKKYKFKVKTYSIKYQGEQEKLQESKAKFKQEGWKIFFEIDNIDSYMILFYKEGIAATEETDEVNASIEEKYRELMSKNDEKQLKKELDYLNESKLTQGIDIDIIDEKIKVINELMNQTIVPTEKVPSENKVDSLAPASLVKSRLIKMQGKQYILDIIHASLINVNDEKEILKFKDEFELARECQVKAGIDISEDIEKALYGEDDTKVEETSSKDDMVDNQIGKPENLEKDQKSESQEIEEIEMTDKEPKVVEKMDQDIWDVSEGIPLGNGCIAHKDKETNEIYVIDKDGKELFRAPNALVNDMGLIIEFLRSILKLDNEVKATQQDELLVMILRVVEKYKNEEPWKLQLEIRNILENTKVVKLTAEDEKLQDKLSKILDDKENTKDEDSEVHEPGTEDLDNDKDDKTDEKLAELKRQIDEKKNQEVMSQINEKNKLISKVITYMRNNDKDFVSNEEILSYKKPAESIIFAKERAIAAKQKIVMKELKTAPNTVLSLILKAYQNKNKEEINNFKLNFFKFPELNEN
jgi:hypothetical protein